MRSDLKPLSKALMKQKFALHPKLLRLFFSSRERKENAYSIRAGGGTEKQTNRAATIIGKQLNDLLKTSYFTYIIKYSSCTSSLGSAYTLIAQSRSRLSSRKNTRCGSAYGRNLLLG